MKSYKHITLSVLVFIALSVIVTSMSSCSSGDGDGDPNPQTDVTTKLQGTWKIQSLIVDGVDKTSLFPGFTINFVSSNSFNTSNGGSVFPSSGSYGFADSNATVLRLGGVPDITFEVTDTSLKMMFSWTKNTFGSGRRESISGQHVFTMNK
ncbi:MAG: hypothetical protein WAU36_03685 [Cyclobacteriaceae bacterium]